MYVALGPHLGPKKYYLSSVLPNVCERSNNILTYQIAFKSYVYELSMMENEKKVYSTSEKVYIYVYILFILYKDRKHAENTQNSNFIFALVSNSEKTKWDVTQSC